MNFLCHAIPLLSAEDLQPLSVETQVRAVCTGVPDFLSVIDRKIRARGRAAEPLATSDDCVMRGVAAGILDHHADDRWFHGGETFVRLNLEFAVALRDRLPGDSGFRPSFVGHILIEMLLDANYVLHARELSNRYYDLFDSVALDEIADGINQITGKPTDRIPETLRRFAEARFIEDYIDDESLMMRLNQVMSRVGLEKLPEEVRRWLPEARSEVLLNHARLLSPPGRSTPYPPLG